MNRPSVGERSVGIDVNRFTIFGVVTFILVLVATYMSLVVAPLEDVQGVHQKIFYIHVPLAFIA